MSSFTQLEFLLLYFCFFVNSIVHDCIKLTLFFIRKHPCGGWKSISIHKRGVRQMDRSESIKQGHILLRLLLLLRLLCSKSISRLRRAKCIEWLLGCIKKGILLWLLCESKSCWLLLLLAYRESILLLRLLCRLAYRESILLLRLLCLLAYRESILLLRLLCLLACRESILLLWLLRLLRCHEIKSSLKRGHFKRNNGRTV